MQRDATTPSEPSCSTMTNLQAGRNYGDYSLTAIRVDEDLVEGSYTLRAGEAGTVKVYLEDGTVVAELAYDREASVADNTQQTVILDGLFELDVRSQSQTTLAGLAESIFDGCHRIVVTGTTSIESGQVYGGILVEAVELDASAPSGTYTFFSASGNAGQVEARRDGVTAATLGYDWTVAIGAGDSFSFEFPDLLTLTVTRAMGTSNLFPVASALFDQRHALVVP